MTPPHCIWKDRLYPLSATVDRLHREQVVVLDREINWRETGDPVVRDLQPKRSDLSAPVSGAKQAVLVLRGINKPGS
ncbi:hypothetical protein ACOMHN_025771 [Nucella lapillus]